jgi:HSP20 family protein
MSIIRSFYYDPFTEFDRLFDNAISTRFSNTSQGPPRRDSSGKLSFQPRMDIQEDEKANTVIATFELPGLKKEDVNIDVHHNRLSISGEVKTSTERNENGYAIRERSYGGFSRTLQLPVGIKPEEIKASMEDGVLRITFPKATPEQAPKKITIN